jgi:hypothetical protein
MSGLRSQKVVAFPLTALAGLSFKVPPDPISADSGEEPAVAVHLIPDEYRCERVVFVGARETQTSGYRIELDRLRADGERWVRQLAQKRTLAGHTPAVVMLAEALSRKLS